MEQRRLVSVITTSGRQDLLLRTLASLRACQKPQNHAGIYVVENGPEKKVETIVKEFKIDCPLHYIYYDHAGKSAALNHMLSKLVDEWVYFSDDDIRFDNDALNAVSRALLAIEGRAFFGGPVDMEYEQEPQEWLKTEMPFHDGWRLQASGITEVSSACFFGGNWIANVLDLSEIGGFPRSLGPSEKLGGEETYAQRRLIEAGVKAYYISGAHVWHYLTSPACTPERIIDKVYKQSFAHSAMNTDSFKKKSMFLFLVLSRLIKYSIYLCWYLIKNKEPEAFHCRCTIAASFAHARGMLRRPRRPV